APGHVRQRQAEEAAPQVVGGPGVRDQRRSRKLRAEGDRRLLRTISEEVVSRDEAALRVEDTAGLQERCNLPADLRGRLDQTRDRAVRDVELTALPGARRVVDVVIVGEVEA